MGYVAHMKRNLPSNNAHADLVSVVDAARILNRGIATVNRWAATGRLPTTAKAPGLRGARLFDRRDVEALAAELGRVSA